MQPEPILCITHDDAVWQHWRQLHGSRWIPARGQALQDLDRWRKQGRSLALLDGNLPRLPSWGDQAWKTLSQDMQMLVASTNPNNNEAAQILAAGAGGYLHAYSPPEVLSRALSTVQAGSIWAGRSLVAQILHNINQRLPGESAWTDNLTPREIEVARRAASGISNQAIGEDLGISERTVRAHMSAVFEKLGINDRLLLALKVHGIQ
ncbi:MAG TPA: response regulator transcription factor [Eoetvoesiella sp.]|uniref:helix-turn-helix transcriptional regulator n=1 Tax=Eoetvoesiella sp. TaxID=1966355 RepID=UPI002D09DA5D|nr:response regulator transcription factor [Eoetvoesiella sp.]HWK60875.1 response regulator transcription factor [Eoetvoesiella sp.]